jgi:ribosome biogenesis GTPase
VGDVDYELEESSDTVTGTIHNIHEKELHRSEISEFIPSDAYYCLLIAFSYYCTINNPPTTLILLIVFSNG